MNIKKMAIIITLLILFFNESANASFFGLFDKQVIPIVFNVDVSRKGTVIESDFKIKTKCTYGFYIKFFHKNKQWNELDNIISGKNSRYGITIPVKLNVNRKIGNNLVVIYNKIVDTKGSSSHTNEFTERNIDYIFLEKGEYSFYLETLNETPEISDIYAVFEIKVWPKTSCD